MGLLPGMTAMNDAQFFDAGFKALTGHAPMRWQGRLFSAFVTNQIPDAVDLPTGLGKTSVIAIWLIALAAQANNGGVRLPRRLVYVVNRRTVVDQGTAEAERIRCALRAPSPDPAVVETGKRLEALCVDPAGDASPLAISTLRGEHADNREWQAGPARAAIIVGTVDMIGSRLLFSGYGAGRSSRRALSAGLLGHDALIVHDEAHLSPAFSTLLHEIVCVQRTAEERRPLRVLELSATRRANGKKRTCAEASEPFTLAGDEKRDDIVRQRLTAAKALRFEDVDDPDELPGRIAAAAVAHADSRACVLVYVSTPKLAGQTKKEIEDRLPKTGEDRVGLLTGVLRGYERDRMVEGAMFAFRAADRRDPPPHTQYLVATSAGEVGIDLDADHMVCDLTTLDSMIQRLGRVNRLGRADADFVSRVDVFAVPADRKGKKTDDGGEASSSYEMARGETRKALDRLAGRSDGRNDASPTAMRDLVEALGPAGIERAFAPMPRLVPVTDILLDAWALTSVRTLPGRPPVERWLHGVESKFPDTVVVWRAEAKDIADLPLSEDRWAEIVDEWFDAHPFFARERLRDRSDRVAKQIGEVAKRDPDAKALLVRPSSLPERIALADAADKDVVGDATLILPIEVGGFDPSTGMLDGKKELQVEDVADLTSDPKQARLRVLLTRPGGRRLDSCCAGPARGRHGGPACGGRDSGRRGSQRRDQGDPRNDRQRRTSPKPLHRARAATDPHGRRGRHDARSSLDRPGGTRRLIVFGIRRGRTASGPRPSSCVGAWGRRAHRQTARARRRSCFRNRDRDAMA